jgi:hypothetical protein
MECVRNDDFDSYTRYRTTAAAALQVAREQASMETVGLTLALSAFWGYVFYIVLRAVV